MNRKLTEFVLIIDSSKAMRGLEDAVTEGFNSTLRELQAAEGEALITTMLFNDRYELFHDRTELQAAAPLTERDYVVRGGTALLDAIGRAMHKFRWIRHGTKAEFRAEKVLFIIMPDGRAEEYRLGGYGPDDAIVW